jgi:hypothetical protein
MTSWNNQRGIKLIFQFPTLADGNYHINLFSPEEYLQEVISEASLHSEAFQCNSLNEDLKKIFHLLIGPKQSSIKRNSY